MLRRQALAAALCLGLAQAACAGPLPAEQFFQRPQFDQALLSPSGSRLALTVLSPQGRVGLYVVDLRAADLRARQVVLLSDADVMDPHWVGEEQLLFSTRDLQAGLAADTRRAPGLYVVRHDGQELLPLVEAHGRPPQGEGRRPRTLPWNHLLLHVPATEEAPDAAAPQDIIVGELVFSGAELSHIHPKWLNLKSRRTRSLAMPDPPCPVQAWWFSPAGQPRAVRCRSRGQDSLHWLHAGPGGELTRWREIAQAPQGQLGLQPRWVGQGDNLIVEQASGPQGESLLAPFDFSRDKPGEPLLLAPGFDFSGALIGDALGQRLLGIRVQTDAEQTIWLDPAHQAEQQRVDAALPGRVNRLSCRRCGSEDAVVLVRSFSDQDPGQLLLWRQAAGPEGRGRWALIGQRLPELDPAEMASTDLVRIPARDGRDLPVWLTRQPGPQGARPAVVLVHGGPWVRGRYWEWQALPQFLASRGWLVIEPEFRGSAGYGRAHLHAGFRQWGQAMQDDVADALLWAQRQGLASQAACIVGGSYGGYSTLMGLIRHPELYRCGSAWVAVTDPLLLLDGSIWVRDNISDSARRYSLPQMVGEVERDREMLLANSPLAQAARIKRPLQLFWGSEDQRVPIAHGRRLRAAMLAAGQEPEWVVYEGEAHGWRRREHQLDFAQRLERFLARHLGPADEAAGPAGTPP